MPLTQDQFNKLRLFRADNIGPVIFRKLLHKFGTAGAAIDALSELNQQYKKKMTLRPERELEHEITALEKAGGGFVFLGDQTYPTPLKFIHDYPPVLSVLGNKNALNKKYIGIVGNRNASAPALKFTEQLANDICGENYGIISGLARGIDTAAHKGALAAQGQTIAVVAGGVNHIYPQENNKLYSDIIKTGGAIISEMPWDFLPTPNHFPRRNRIVSGISLGVVVVECAKRSGSLITAKLALEQNREVFAVPGNPMDPRASGPNHLIKSGATMVETATDITKNATHWLFDDNAPMLDKAPEPEQQKLAIAEAMAEILPLSESSDSELSEKIDNSPTDQILALLSPSTPTDMDTIIRATSLSQRHALGLLSELDLDGKIIRAGSGYLKA